MAEIDANVVAGPPCAAASARAARSGRRGVAQGAGGASGGDRRRRAGRADGRQVRPGSIRTCWAACCATCWRMRRATRRRAAASCWAAGAVGDRLEFRVEDDGPGIDAVDLPFIFEKFYRGKKGASKGKGTGMGLAISRAILAAHGGGIEVESAPGQGSLLPLLGAAGGKGAGETPRQGRGTQISPGPARNSPSCGPCGESSCNESDRRPSSSPSTENFCGA